MSWKGKEATEILAFVLSDTDRTHDGEIPNQVAVAYALKGYSLTSDMFHKMIEVRNECHDLGIHVVANCFDGQWSKLTTCSIDGKPLAQLQFQKDCWSKYVQQSKAALIDKLVNCCHISKDAHENMSHTMFFGSQKFDFGNARISRFSKGNKTVLAAETTCDETHNIPMMTHITTTHVKSAWFPKGTEKKDENNDINHNENNNIIYVLSLIPAEILNSRIEMMI